MGLAELAEVGGFTVVCAGFLAMLKWLIKSFSKQSADQTRAITTNTLVLLGMQKQQLIHDLQVRGLNPSTGDNNTERGELAYQAYLEILEYLEDLTKKIEAGGLVA